MPSGLGLLARILQVLGFALGPHAASSLGAVWTRPAAAQPGSLPSLRFVQLRPFGALRAGCDRRLDGQVHWLPMKPRDGPAAELKETIMTTNEKTSNRAAALTPKDVRAAGGQQ